MKTPSLFSGGGRVSDRSCEELSAAIVAEPGVVAEK